MHFPFSVETGVTSARVTYLDSCLACHANGVRLGDRVVVGGKAGVADNLKIGDDVVLGGGSIVLSNVPAGRVMMGYPATKMQTHIEGYKALRRLPRTLPALNAVTSQVSAT